MPCSSAVLYGYIHRKKMINLGDNIARKVEEHKFEMGQPLHLKEWKNTSQLDYR